MLLYTKKLNEKLEYVRSAFKTLIFTYEFLLVKAPKEVLQCKL